MIDNLSKGIIKMRDNLPNMLRAAAKEWREKNKVVATGATRYDAALEEAADSIEELQKRVPKVPHGRLIEWVSAKERLPEVGKSVLCACRANIYEVMKMRTDGAWVHNDAVYDSAYMGGFVTYWAELPTIIPAEEE